jgi:3-oxoacyl-[acyl-carrier protein] reductase
MADRYAQLVRTPVGKLIAGNTGLPQPVPLQRFEPGQPLVDGPVLLGQAPGGRLAGPVAAILADAGASVHTELREDVRSAAAEAGLDARIWNLDAADGQRFKALVFDATGIASSEELRVLWDFFHSTVRRVERSGRILVLGSPPEDCSDVREATAQRALEGFVRALGKEVRGGSTTQLVYVTEASEPAMASTLRFLLSPRSAYVSGQVVRVGASQAIPDVDWDRPLDAQTALVTGASRGIGESIARTLARDGARVVGLDVPSAAEDLGVVTDAIGGSALSIDITDSAAPTEIADHLADHGGVDVVVHNAGVTRDRTLGRMPKDDWLKLMEINLSSEERIGDELLGRDVLAARGRIVCVSSISGIAGNAGQTNYSTSKAGVIGMVQSMAPVLAERGGSINAVAPGFIETQMTAAMPLFLREGGRRMNTMAQGGLPVDVAETVAWLAAPASVAVNGNIVRVCGQSLVGA